MINLAGEPPDVADPVCREELERVGIPVVFAERSQGEVTTIITGRLGPFVLTRAWCYWVVRGPMPIGAARRMYAADTEKVVRVAGHAGAPEPDEWARWQTGDGDPIVPERHRARYDAYPDAKRVFADDPASHPDAWGVVESYHIDTPAGLQLFTDTARRALVDAVMTMNMFDERGIVGVDRGDVILVLADSGWSPWRAARRLGMLPSARGVYFASSGFGGWFW